MAFKLPGRRGSTGVVRPVEIGRRILREMDATVDVDTKGRRIAPNRFRVTCSSESRNAHAAHEAAIISELIDAATSYAKDEGYHLLGPVTISIDTDPGLTGTQFTVTAAMSGGAAAAAPAPAPAPQPAPAPAPAPAPVATPEPAPLPDPVIADDDSNIDDLPPPIVTAAPEPVAVQPTPTEPLPVAIGAVVMSDGTRRPLSNTVCSIGRASENTLTIADAQASRRHAEIRYENGRHVLVDLGSTNGTVVNGSRLGGPHSLTHGDIITIGAMQLRYEAS